MQDMWYRIDNAWHFLPVPGCVVAPWQGKWTAFMSNCIMPQISRSTASEDVKRAVWEYFDRRVEV